MPLMVKICISTVPLKPYTITATLCKLAVVVFYVPMWLKLVFLLF